MRLKGHFLTYTLLPLFVLFVGASYVRFMVQNDYLVSYEGTCDPYAEACFVGCNDDECTDVYYYSEVEKYAPYVQSVCGSDITDCEDANTCTASDRGRCTVLYCTDGESRDCDTLTEADRPHEESENTEPVIVDDSEQT